MDGVIDEYPDSFSFHKQFEKIAGKLTGRDRWDVYDEMQEKAKRLAERLLKENFPAMRQKGLRYRRGRWRRKRQYLKRVKAGRYK